MPAKLEIPDDQKFAFNRIMRRMPEEIRKDEGIRRTMLMYLKVGGEKLALAGLRAVVTPFTEKFVLKKVQALDEDDTLVSAGNGEEDGKSDEEKAEGESPTEESKDDA